MRTLVIVSPDKSDIYFANQLANALNVVGIVVENQTPDKDRSSLATKAIKYLSTPGQFFRKVLEVMDRRFIEPRQPYNDPANSLDFGEEGRVLVVKKGVEILRTQGVNAINSPEYQSWIRDRRPDVIAVCGASILRADLLAIPEYGVLNLHGGLSQFYRGLFTTDWAIHNREPECVGATVHFVSEGVDDGDVVYQGRPRIEVGDHPNSLYEKVVRLGVQMMVRAISDIEQSRCVRSRLESKGDLYLHNMFHVAAKRTTWRQIETGAITDYLANQIERDQRVRGALINEFSTPTKVS
ncbi:formyl transferase [Marinobacter algicola]|uniref:phosphoribosylglycinamide formyltransferase 1 n=1 Tax=Marinobacter algicola DG893 TaxID=443152 RepID=A6EWZ6_9GAMM|nr:formyl transferase [Marinobacter algicola]EDM49010.1 Methionyl-tRNA formyltransferase [Marinobacter algicola DG893]